MKDDSRNDEQLKATLQQLRASDQQQRAANHDLGERVKELSCLYGISQIAEQQSLSLEEALRRIVNCIPPGWHYPEITCARVVIEGQQVTTDRFEDTTWKQSSDVLVHGKKAGVIEVFYLEEKPELDEGPFLKEERNLLNAVALQLGGIIGRKRAEERLKATNQQLTASIQQMRATEQQLKAANQQLRASEQQLKGTNQQLRASEQQLQASNQQLRASEQQLRAFNQQLRASEQQLRASNQQLKASEQQLRGANHNLGERVKELSCLYGISQIAVQQDLSSEEVLRGIVNLIPPGWHYPEITCARVIMEDQQVTTDNFKATKWKQSADVLVYWEENRSN